MSTDEEYRKLAIGNITEVEMKKATELYNSLVSADEYKKKFEAMSNSELAKELINNIWADIPMLTEKSELINEVVDRLRSMPSLEREDEDE